MSNVHDNPDARDTIVPLGEEAQRELATLAETLERYALHVDKSAVAGTKLYRWKQGYAAGHRAAAHEARKRATRGL